MGRGGAAQGLLNVDTRRFYLREKSTRFPLNRLQIQSEHSGEDNNPGRPVITITWLSRLVVEIQHTFKMYVNVYVTADQISLCGCYAL
jgi:hypothetical protein